MTAGPKLSRRQVLGAGLLAGAWALGAGPQRLVQQAVAACPTAGSLGDIDHLVIFIQENRSFDHYFGSYRGVTGFSDPHALHQANGLSIFAQPDPANTNPANPPVGHLLPFHLQTENPSLDGECTNDITHDWAPQHLSWNQGRMDGFVTQHLAANGVSNGPLTMSYYTRADLPFYYALADAFTICDRYHCSVMGPTYPNRLYTVSATLDPDGDHGGPLLQTTPMPDQFTWRTMPEQLEAAGISWKVYSSPDGQADNVLSFFKTYDNPASPLFRNAFLPTFPGELMADIATGSLPTISWVLAPLPESEHPAAPPAYGEYATAQILQALVANPALWAKTALLVTYDENGGFFDHVPPPVAPPGTPGEYLTVSTLPAGAGGIRGPIGLGFRVPFILVSPFSRGGLVCSDVFDHTSVLRLIETRWGVEVPNLSAWRRATTGDLTAAFNFAAPDRSVPSLPATSLTDPNIVRQCALNSALGTEDQGQVYPVPPNQMPGQEPGHGRRPSGPVRVQACASPSAAVTSSPATPGRARGGATPPGGGGTTPATPSGPGGSPGAAGPVSPAGGVLPFTGEAPWVPTAGALALAGVGGLLALRRRLQPGSVGEEAELHGQPDVPSMPPGP